MINACFSLHAGKVFLHEWAHLRWGLGDEYARADRGESAFYIGTPPLSHKPAVNPVRCSETVQGQQRRIENGQDLVDCFVNQTSGLPRNDCYFAPNKRQNATASVLFDITSDNVCILTRCLLF